MASDLRVADGVKTLALLAVVAGHSVAWTVEPNFVFGTTLDSVPNLWWLTWAFQVLPLFFFLSSTGLRRVAAATDGTPLAGRVALLVVPAIPLYALALLIAWLVGRFHPNLEWLAGLIPVQLTWFIGVYVLVLAAAPLLVRIRGTLGFIGWFAAVVLIDWTRFHVHDIFGWLNMFVAWSMFVLLGLRLPQLRQLSRAILIGWLVAAVFAAGVFINLGPYSKALVSTKALPGATNLAPPTLVLLCVGFAQVALLLLLWPALARLFSFAPVWAVLSRLSNRAMQIYLYHLVIVGLLALALSYLNATPKVVSLVWWLEHIVVFMLAVVIVYLLSPALRSVSGVVGVAMIKLWRPRHPASKSVSITLSALLGLAILLDAAVGTGRPFGKSQVIGISVQPAVLLGAIFVLTALLTGFARSARAAEVD